MPMGEIETRMSAHEATVLWPEYWDYRRRENEREAAKQEGKRR